MKTCSKCKLSKELTEFGTNKTKKDGLQYSCKICQRAYCKSHYDRNKNVYAKKARRHSLKLRNIVRKLKNLPCKDCGISYPYYVMEYDHLKDKTGNVGILANRGNLKKVLAEIEKCELVCANCHRERTHQRQIAGVV